MKADHWSLMRQIVLAVEDNPIGTVQGQPSIDGYSDDEIGYHVHLLVEAGLAQGTNVRNLLHSHPHVLISGLTLAGHEFAELARDEIRWSDALAEARSTGGITLNKLRRLLETPKTRQSSVKRSATNLAATEEQDRVRQPHEENLMYIIANRALVFLRDGYNSDQLTVRPGRGPQQVPCWVRESPTFKCAVTDGSVMEVEIKTPLPMQLTASKSTPAAPGVFDQTGLGQQRMPADPAALFPGREYPRWMYHATEKPKMVSSRQEEVALGSDWSRVYIYQEYPKVKYHWNGKDITVKGADEEAALGGGWANTPAAFAPYKGPREAGAEHNPERWVDEWPISGLSAEGRKRIKAQLWRADSEFWKSPDAPSADSAAMRLAFDGVASTLFSAGILTEQLLRDQIPLFVWDSAIAAGWWRLASETTHDIFREKLGHYWVWREEGKDWQGLFRSETAKWRAQLLEHPPAPGESSPANGAPNADTVMDILTPISGAEEAANETAADEHTSPRHGLPERYTRLFDYISKKFGSSSDGGFSTAFRRAEARRLEAERELRKSLVQQLSDGSDQNLESLCPLDLLVHFRSYAERSFEAIGAECVELFRDVDAFQSFLYVVMEWVTKGILPTPSTPQETIDRLMALADHTAELIERTGTRDLMGGDWIAALDDARENLRRASLQGTDLDAEAVSSEEPNIRLRESLSAFRQRIGEHDPDTLLLMGGDWERMIDVVLADLIRTEADCAVTLSGKSFLLALRNEANRDSAEQFLMVALEQLNGVLVASWWEQSAASPSGNPAGADRTESAHIAGVNRPAVVLGTAGLPHGRPAESVFAADPKIRKLVETDPKIVPHVNLIAQFQQAQAEAEVAFRQRELTENWAEWSGPYPWAEEKDPDTTDCPWWVAGAEYVFHLAAAWRKHSPGNKENVGRLLPEQVASLANWFYNSRLLAHDIVEGKNPYADDLLGGGNARRFSNVAFLFAMQKFAESDLNEWREREALLGAALNDLKGGRPNEPASSPPVGIPDPLAPALGNTSSETADDANAPSCALDPTPPRRTPDLQSSRNRLDLVNALARELATIKQDLKRFCTAEDLKQKHPQFILWEHIDKAELKELADGVAFAPKAYAENLTLRKFGITSRETLKKDRKKLRQAQKPVRP